MESQHLLLTDAAALLLTGFAPVYPADGADLEAFIGHYPRSVFSCIIVCCVYSLQLQSACGPRRGRVDLVICRSEPGFLYLDEGLTVQELEKEAAADCNGIFALTQHCRLPCGSATAAAPCSRSRFLTS